MTRRIVTTLAGMLPIPELVRLQQLRVAVLLEFARLAVAVSRIGRAA